ncbi:hypothetical protein B296_00008707 [Ensete ventricosum]|uniref:Transcription repressor n=1 Tax=Ensete ventricosum TaxID=4639 RepID=A0A426ZWJ6_ENSVE|nr:hypothetical protein B296_00008707 [Ensete ventricosum]
MGKKGLQKSIRVCLSKLKKVPSHLHIPNSPHPAAATAATSWLLSACKYPKTPSFAVDRGPAEDNVHDPAATLSDVDRFLCENFHSLYLREDEPDNLSEATPRGDEDERPPPAAFCSSERFFVSSGASSRTNEAGAEARGGGVAVVTFSKDPYDDFRRSMQGMVDARHVEPNQPLDWDFMKELLFCYLELNDRSVHKHILRAFTDLTVSFRRRAAAERRRAPAGIKGRRRSRRSAQKAGEVRDAAPRHLLVTD